MEVVDTTRLARVTESLRKDNVSLRSVQTLTSAVEDSLSNRSRTPFVGVLLSDDDKRSQPGAMAMMFRWLE